MTDALWLHCAVSGAVLVVAALVAWRLGRLHWLSTSFWALGAFALYFVVHPLASLVTGRIGVYADMLAYAGGADRVQWMTLVVAAGLVAFFGASLLTSPGTAGAWARREQWAYARGWPPGSLAVLVAALGAAAYSMIAFRLRLGGVPLVSAEIDQGRFVGDVTGYQFMLHLLALYPIALLDSAAQAQPWGRIVMLAYVGLRLFDPWDRHSVVSLLLAVSMTGLAVAGARAATARRRWPARAWIVAVLLVTGLLQIREHQSLGQWWRGDPRLEEPAELVSGADSAMLPGLYLRSYVDEEKGWTYGLDLAGHALFGWLPRKIAPWKDSLPELLLPGRARVRVPAEEALAGTKSTILGSFYSFGGLAAVVLAMALLGWLLVKAERFLAPDVAPPVQTLACVGLAMLWMILGSDASWGLAMLYLVSMPGLGLLLLHLLARRFRPAATAPLAGLEAPPPTAGSVS